MIGQTLAHYRITAALGAGGMGEVWQAEDTKLGRDVALKVLSEEFADDAERLERFEREARAVATLNHPHIVTIFSVEEAEGVRFLTMELIEGRSLDKLIPEGGLELALFLELATPLAEAISAAHDKSVIHRDLKPSNVMVDGENRVKVLDFGLAKLQHGGEASDSTELPTEALTGVGTLVGTVPYMSPEQIESKIIDHRTDIFSLGVLLYEMATGKRPFSGDSQPALMSSILRDVPESVFEVRDDVPRHLGRMISRCLEKDRRDRYQTARDVFNELRALTRESSGQSVTPVSRPGRPAWTTANRSRAIAVAPFRAPSASPELATLAEGLAEDIAAGLARFPYLTIIDGAELRPSDSSTSAAADRGARYVLRGGLRSAGPELRLSVQLVEVESGTHVWSEAYDRRLEGTSLFELQDDLTDRIVSSVGDYSGVLLRLVATELRSMDDDEMTVDDWIMRAVCFQHVLHPPDEHAAIRDGLEKMVEQHPDNAEAYAWLAITYRNEYSFDYNLRDDSIGRSLRAAQRAVDLDPTSQAGWDGLAGAHFFAGDIPAFEAAATRAIALNPRNSYTTAVMGLFFGNSGQQERGSELGLHACALNPHHPEWYPFVTYYFHYDRREYEEAIAVIKGINWPRMPYSYINLAAAYGQLGRLEEARTAIETLVRDFGYDVTRVREEFAKWGHTESFIEHLADGLRKAGMDDDANPQKSSAVRPPSEAAVETEGAVTIAILPFNDLSPAKDQDYFCEGMAEEIMNALVHVDGIRVASRTSAFRAVEEGGDLQAIGCRLAVGQILEGSVRAAGDRLRVTAQLTDVESGYQVWSERYDREAEDVFAIQDEIAAGVVEAVTSRLTTGERTLREREKVGNLEAYRHYLKGRHFRYSKNDHVNALRCYEQAVALDPSHAPSWVAIAESKMLGAMYNLLPPQHAIDEARSALATAETGQGESAEALYVRGQIAYSERDWVEAERVFRRAIELEPDHVRALCWYAVVLATLRRRDEALDLLEHAREIDPLAAYPYGMTAAALLFLGEQGAAFDFATQAAAFEEANTLTLWGIGISAVALGRFDEGMPALEEAVELGRRSGYLLGLYGWALGEAGRSNEAEAVLDELRARPVGAPTVVPEGWILAALGRTEEAWEVLDRATEEKQPVVSFIGYPGYDPLREDPRFPAFVQRLGLPPSPSPAIEYPPVETTEIAEKSIAVLPFVNMSADLEDEYFSDGLSEEIINSLTRLPDLRVIARTSAFRFRGEQDLRTVGRKLGVRTVLEGSVRRADRRLRITAQLIDVADDSHIWSERFDREMTDVFQIQDEIAGAIAEKFQVGLGVSEIEKPPTPNIAAYEALLEARHFFLQFTPTAAERARASLERALDLEPDYPDALVMQAFYHLMMAYMFTDPRDALPNVRAFAERALQLDPRHGEAQAAAAVMAVFWDRDWSASENLFRRALELSPASARVHELYGLCCLLGQGRFAEALAELDRAIELDPLSALYAGNRGRVLTCARRFAEAEESCRRGLAIDPGQLLAQVELTYALLFDGRFEEAIAVGKRAVETHGPVNAPRQALALSYAWSGRRDEAFELVGGTAEDGAGYRSPLARGLVHAAFSEMDEAFADVERSLDELDPLFAYLAVHPMFDNLRVDPRYANLLARMNLSEGGSP